MRQAGKIVARVLEVLIKQVRPGRKTKDFDNIAAGELGKLGAKPSFKGYRGFPANLCVSVNDEIVHGIPGERLLKGGDIVSFDLGAILGGFQGDAAVTVGVGEISSSPRFHQLGLIYTPEAFAWLSCQALTFPSPYKTWPACLAWFPSLLPAGTDRQRQYEPDSTSGPQ